MLSVFFCSNDKLSRLIQMKQSEDLFLRLDFHLCDKVDEGLDEDKFLMDQGGRFHGV